jgi:polyisoprenoid-binding protein YceI
MRGASRNTRPAAFYHQGLRLFSYLTFYLLCGSMVAATEKNSHQRTFVFKPATTSIHWTLGGTLHTVHGTFKLKRGTVEVNLDDNSADGLIEIDATSGESGNAARDQRMRQSVLESDRYPIISLRPTHVLGKLASSSNEVITVEGVFRIHGTEHPIQLRIDLHPEGEAITLKTHFTVPYVDWGMKDPSILFFRVDKTVNIDIDAAVSAGD